MKGLIRIASTWRNFKSSITSIDQETIAFIETMANLASNSAYEEAEENNKLGRTKEFKNVDELIEDLE